MSAEADKLFSDAISIERAGDYDAAFKAYLAVAHKYLAARRDTTTQSEIDEINKKYQRVLDRAQKTKSLRNPGLSVQPSRDQDLLLRASSTINGRVYPLWTANQRKTIPHSSPSLSNAQKMRSATYKRPRNYIMHTAQEASEVVQNVIDDCSVVASLSACNAHNKRFGTCLALNAIHPQTSNGQPTLSDNGVYDIRFFFNGAWRRLTINDDLPTTPDSQILSATTTSTTTEIWPALLEKAIMTLWGTYEFSGSNSSTDLQMLTGWIPEQVHFHDPHFKQESVWQMILNGWSNGTCLITLGSKQSREAIPADFFERGFIENHAYAVRHLKEKAGRRSLTVVDQWDKHCRAICLDWEYVTNHFDAAYLSWDPDIFACSDSTTFAIEGSVSRGVNVGQHHPLERCPQFVVNVDSEDWSHVWILLTRHVKNNHLSTVYSALHTSRHVVETGTHSASHSNSINELVKQSAKRDVDIGVVVSQLVDDAEGSHGSYSYTLTAYSTKPVKIVEASKSYAYSQKVSGTWSLRTAGGHCLSRAFGINPHYTLRIHPARNAQTQLRLVLEAEKDIPVNVKLLWGSEERVFDLKVVDVLGDSGVYTHKLAVLECDNIAARKYTVVVSTFESNQLSAYTLYADCTAPLTLHPLPQEGSGMFTTRDVKGMLDGEVTYAFKIPRQSQVRFRVEREVLSVPMRMRVRNLEKGIIEHEEQSLNTSNLILNASVDPGDYAVVLDTLNHSATSVPYRLKMWTQINGVEIVDV